MLNITNVVNIMRLTEAVYESDKKPATQTPDDFKPVKDSHDTKRYLWFRADVLMHASYTHE